MSNGVCEMPRFIVKYSVKGAGYFSETVQAQDPGQAQRLIESRYPTNPSIPFDRRVTIQSVGSVVK